MNRDRIITLRELLLLTTFLALCAAGFARGKVIDVRLALAVCTKCTFFVSLKASPPFRKAYLVTFAIVLVLMLLDAAARVDVVKHVYMPIRNAMFRSGYDEYRLKIFRVILLVSISYVVARLRVAVRRPTETTSTPSSSQQS